mmetsp:Transcript_68088/g.121296  ORF Transcript_68088/g.121296 Transcript_68088/m.121296 type:complete len:1020 (-) Transcript_68088:10-3069(-)
MTMRCILLALVSCAWSLETAFRHTSNQTGAVQIPRSSAAVSQLASAAVAGHYVSSKHQQANLKLQYVNTTDLALQHLQLECGRHLKMHPAEVSCPATCPYLRSEPTRVCEFKCVEAKDCGDDNPLTSFANPESLRCEACLVPACELCTTSSKRECAKCHPGFELRHGHCLSIWRHAWRAFYLFVLFVVGLVALYLVQLFRRNVTNFESLKHGLDFRYLSSIRNTESGSQWSLKTDMQNNPRPAGLATMLHFRFMGTSMLWGLSIMAMLLMFGLYFQNRRRALRAFPENTFSACDQNVRDAKDSYNDMETFYFFITVFIYLASTAGSIVFARKQRDEWEETMADETTFGQFALLTTGFPILDGTKDVEKDFENFLRKAPQLQETNIVGVSVCWNCRDKQTEIDAAIAYERSQTKITAWGDTIDRMPRDDQDEGKRSCCDPQLRCVDTLLGVGNVPCAKPQEEKSQKEEHADVSEVLDSLKTTENVFIIFKTPREASVAKELIDKEPLKYEGSEISLHYHDYEPLTVLWDGWGCSSQESHMRIGFGWLIIISAVLFLDIFFYAPYVQYIMSYTDVAGMSQGGFFTGTILGMLITVCNQIIYQVITLVAQSCGWCNSDKKMRFYVIQYTLAVLFNTCVDLWTVIILARGYAMDDALQQQAVDDSTLSAKAIAESPSIQKALYVQMVAYIFPSCLLLPFLLEPIVATCAPYFMGKALVGSRKDVSIEDAEACLQLNPYDLSRYGDVLVNIMLCCIMFAFTYPNLWQIWLYFLVSMSVIYVWDKVRVLRFSFRSYYASNIMDMAMSGMSAMPCGILAACVAFRIYGAKDEGFIEELVKPKHDFLNLGAGEIMMEAFRVLSRYTIVPICVGVFFLHCIVHWCLLKYFVYGGKADEEEIHTQVSKDLERSRSMNIRTYEDYSEDYPASWFTVNPVHCLRSKYKYSKNTKYKDTDNPPCSLYQKGKPFLIERNEKLGVYFQFKDRSLNIPNYEERNASISFRERWQRFIDGYGHKAKVHSRRECVHR